MPAEFFLPGSLPCDTAEQSFRIFGGALGQWLDYMPDGEVGTRRYWIDGIAYRVFNGHPEIETIKYPAPRERRREMVAARPSRRVRLSRAARRQGRALRRSRLAARLCPRRGEFLRAVSLHEEGRCDPAACALSGLHTAHLQLGALSSSRTKMSTRSFRASPKRCAPKSPRWSRSFRTTISQFSGTWPSKTGMVDTALGRTRRRGRQEGSRARVARRLPMSVPALPKAVHLGHHMCFGTLNGWPSRQPPTLAGAVMLANAAVAASGRKVEFLHIPTLGSAEDAFFAPLKDLKADGARVYMGAIHHLHGARGMASSAQDDEEISAGLRPWLAVRLRPRARPAGPPDHRRRQQGGEPDRDHSRRSQKGRRDAPRRDEELRRRRGFSFNDASRSGGAVRSEFRVRLRSDALFHRIGGVIAAAEIGVLNAFVAKQFSRAP